MPDEWLRPQRVRLILTADCGVLTSGTSHYCRALQAAGSSLKLAGNGALGQGKSGLWVGAGREQAEEWPASMSPGLFLPRLRTTRAKTRAKRLMSAAELREKRAVQAQGKRREQIYSVGPMTAGMARRRVREAITARRSNSLKPAVHANGHNGYRPGPHSHSSGTLEESLTGRTRFAMSPRVALPRCHDGYAQHMHRKGVNSGFPFSRTQPSPSLEALYL